VRKQEGIGASNSLSAYDENFSLCRHYFTNTKGGDVPKCNSNLVSKFHDDPTVKESGIVGLLEKVCVYAKKSKSYV